jgi:hypothetical protein
VNANLIAVARRRPARERLARVLVRGVAATAVEQRIDRRAAAREREPAHHQQTHHPFHALP